MCAICACLGECRICQKQLKRTKVWIHSLTQNPHALSLTSTVPLRCGGKSWKKPRGPGRARAGHFSPPACHRCRWPVRVAASTTSLACSRQRPGRQRWRRPGLAAYLPRAAASRRPVDHRRCPGPTPWAGSDATRGTRVRESSPHRTGARARNANRTVEGARRSRAPLRAREPFRDESE